MAVQRHPIESYAKNLNFWEEFPDYKIHREFGVFWKTNRKNGKLKESSLFMWALAHCYDRKSAIFNQPEPDKWEVTSEDLFGDPRFMLTLAYEEEQDVIILNKTLQEYVTLFEKTIDTPLGISLRLLEKKLADRTQFIMETQYTMDYYETTEAGRRTLKKGTADQLDRMFRDTDKINSLIQKALDDLKASEQGGHMKGGGQASMSDEDESF